MTKMQTKFKQTEIGLIPEDWEVVEYGDICDSISKKFNFTENKVIFLNTGDIENGKIINANLFNPEKLPGQAKKSIQRNDILFSEIRPINRRFALVNFDSKNYVVSTKLMVLRSKNIDNLFFYKHLTSDLNLINFQTLAESRSGTFPQITFDTIKNKKLPLPPLPEQKAIAEILSSLDDKIELLEKQNKTLENIGQALFKSWFVDFEPFQNDLVESEMGMIPRGWKVGKVGDLATIKSGFAFKSEDFSDEGINIIKIKNINDGYIDLKDVDKVDDSKLPNRAFDFELSEGDILVAMSGNTTGKIAMMPKFDGQFLLNQRAGKFFMKEEKNTGFMYFYLKANNIGTLILQTAYGSAQPNISGKDIENFDLIIPRNEVLEKFSNTSNDLIKKINTNIYQIQTLSNLRDTLLPRLMSGKIRVV